MTVVDELVETINKTAVSKYVKKDTQEYIQDNI
jgi:hypothetical protein